MIKSYQVVGSNGAFSHLLGSTITGEQNLIPPHDNFYSFIMGEIDYDLEIQMVDNVGGQEYLFCCLTSDEKCGNVVLEEIV